MPDSSPTQKCPATIFLLVALFFGIGLCFLIPPGAGFDETTHLARVWEMSGGSLIPNQKLSQGPYLPMAFVEVSYRNRYFNTPLESDYFRKFADKKIDWNVFIEHITRSVYFPLSYLPQAFVVGLFERVLSAPVLWMYYLSRLLETLLYIGMTYLAIRLMPFGKWVMAALALAPMALFQASTISSDPYTNAASFLFIAWVLSLAANEAAMTWKQAGVTLLTVALLFAAKPNTAFLVLLLALLPWRKMPKRMPLALLAGTAAIFALFVLGWNALIYRGFYANVPGYGVSGQLAYIFSHPLAFLKTFFGDFGVHGLAYLKEWIGVYAYNTGRVPDIVYPLFALLLVALMVLDVPARAVGRRTRMILLATFVVGYIFTVMILYLTTNKIGNPYIEGVQGRYFILLMPLLILALLPDRALIKRAVSPSIVLAAGSVVVLAIYSLGVYATYFVTCGTSYYTPGLCYQPPYRNWDPNANFSPPVGQGVTLKQSFTAVCTPLRAIRVWSGDALGSTNEGQTTQYLLRDAASGKVVGEKSVANSAAPAHSWLEIPLDPLQNATGRQFEIEISAAGANTGGLEYGISARHEYFDGQFRVNDQPQEADLLFQYGCDVK